MEAVASLITSAHCLKLALLTTAACACVLVCRHPQVAAAVVTAAYPATNKLKAAPNSSSSERQLSVPDDSLLVMARGPLQVQQMALALQTAHQGCEGVSRFVALALTSSFRDTLVKSGDPAVAAASTA
jgi:hypothetical protein